MSKIAFDIDGVLVPDCDSFPNLGGLDAFYALTTYMRPLFKPEGEWYALTAREAQYRPYTIEWIRKYFTNKPIELWHESDSINPFAYKAEIINKHGITKYIESDLNIVKYLRKHTQAEIIHFEDFCSQSFE
jgi:hypothetical protein